GAYGLACTGVDRGEGGDRKVRQDVVPGVGKIVGLQVELHGFGHNRLLRSSAGNHLPGPNQMTGATLSTIRPRRVAPVRTGDPRFRPSRLSPPDRVGRWCTDRAVCLAAIARTSHRGVSGPR